MPFLLGLLAIAGGVVFWMMRARDAGMAAQDLADMANDVRLAARRFGFKRKTNTHPVDSVTESAVLSSALATAVTLLEGLHTAEVRNALQSGIANTLGKSNQDADELIIFGTWLIEQCGTTDQAINRLSRRSRSIAPQDGFLDTMGILKASSAETGADFTPKQNEAIQDIARVYGIK